MPLASKNIEYWFRYVLLKIQLFRVIAVQDSSKIGWTSIKFLSLKFKISKLRPRECFPCSTGKTIPTDDRTSDRSKPRGVCSIRQRDLEFFQNRSQQIQHQSGPKSMVAWRGGLVLWLRPTDSHVLTRKERSTQRRIPYAKKYPNRFGESGILSAPIAGSWIEPKRTVDENGLNPTRYHYQHYA